MEPRGNLKRLIDDISRRRSMSGGMRTMMERERDFPDKLSAQLTGIMLDPNSAALADSLLDEYWSEGRYSQLNRAYYTPVREVIIGSGYHAAVYAATRVLAGFPRPLVIEANERVGGVFAFPRPVFYLNSRTRKGSLGLSGDSTANLNYLPGAPIQSANLAVGEYQTNEDIARVIRLTLAQYARVVPGYEISRVRKGIGDVFTIETNIGDEFRAYRIIDARGLGEPKDVKLANGRDILTFPQFMAKMTDKWPLRGIERAAVIGGGDSARCAIEALLGIGPSPMMGSFIDTVSRVDAYSPKLQSTFDDWCRAERGRYRPIGQFLKPDKFGNSRLNVFQERTLPVDLPRQDALVSSRSYNLVVLATGSELKNIPGIGENGLYLYGESLTGGQDNPVCRKEDTREMYRIGPAAKLSFTTQERRAGIDRIENNKVAMFRLAGKTAALAAKLPLSGSIEDQTF